MSRAALLSLVLVASPAIASEPIEGRATVIDGDTVAIDGTAERIRLYGIDSPEDGQACDDANGARYLCGARSAEYLAQLIGRSGRLRCVEEDRDRYGRIVAECSTPSGAVVNAEMVRAGWAAHYLEYSDGRYRDQYARAREDGAGMWSGAFVLPWDWRRGARLQSERAADGQPSGCPIKGNISAGGERIYHAPGQEHYGRTRIDVGAGERWFCSAAEAEAAGWRAACR